MHMHILTFRLGDVDGVVVIIYEFIRVRVQPVHADAGVTVSLGGHRRRHEEHGLSLSVLGICELDVL